MDRQVFMQKLAPELVEAIEEAISVIKDGEIDGFRLDPVFGVSPEQFLAQAIWSEIINPMATANSSSAINKEVCKEWLNDLASSAGIPTP